jgi:hypothetical protein
MKNQITKYKISQSKNHITKTSQNLKIINTNPKPTIAQFLN